LEEIFEQSYPIEPTANVAIRNGDGAIFVYGSPANEIRVQAIKKAYTYERLKQIVPIWKKEFYEDGSAWLEPRPSSETGS